VKILPKVLWWQKKKDGLIEIEFVLLHNTNVVRSRLILMNWWQLMKVMTTDERDEYWWRWWLWLTLHRHVINISSSPIILLTISSSSRRGLCPNNEYVSGQCCYADHDTWHVAIAPSDDKTILFSQIKLSQINWITQFVSILGFIVGMNQYNSRTLL